MIKLGKKIETAFNEQIINEATNAYFYLSMYNWLENKSYKAAKFFKIQFDEETKHMQMFIDYLLLKTNLVEMPVVNLQKAGKDIEFKNLYHILQEAQKAEEETTKQIYDLFILLQPAVVWHMPELHRWPIGNKASRRTRFPFAKPRFRV